MAGILTQIKEADAARRAGVTPSGPVDPNYPKYVRVKDGSKVLVQNEDEHRAAVPDDAELPENREKKKGKKGDEK